MRGRNGSWHRQQLASCWAPAPDWALRSPARVARADINADAAAATANAIEDSGGTALSIPSALHAWDLADLASIDDNRDDREGSGRG